MLWMIRVLIAGLGLLLVPPAYAQGGTEEFQACMRLSGPIVTKQQDCYDLEIVKLQLTAASLIKELEEVMDEEGFNEVIAAEGLFQEYVLTHCIQEARWAPDMSEFEYTMVLRHSECQRRVFTSRTADLAYLYMSYTDGKAPPEEMASQK